MGSLLKVAIVGLAVVAALLILPGWFPSLQKVAFANQYGITWTLVVAAALGVGGTMKLAAK